MATPVATPKILSQTALPLAIAAQATVPAGKTWMPTSFTICNTSSSPQTVSLNIVLSGGVVSVANSFLSDAPFAAKEMKILAYDKTLPLQAGDAIYASAGTAGVVGMTVAGAEVA